MPIQEERFDYKGFPCVVLFQKMGFRTGYVGIPKEMNVNTDCIDCHGGITYEDTHLYHQNDTDRLWIGFDCGHCCDGYDVEKIKEYFSDDEHTMRSVALMEQTGYYEVCNQHPIRTLEYVKENCKRIVDQILKERD